MDDFNNKNRLEEKAVLFITALHNVYVPEENRDPFISLETSDEMNEDLLAMLMAMKTIACSMCNGLENYDLIDFTHVMNKLVVQHLLESNPHFETKFI